MVVSGGGIHNDYLMERIRINLNHVKVRSYEDLGFDSDSKEAMLFALLAYECIQFFVVPYINVKWK